LEFYWYKLESRTLVNHRKTYIENNILNPDGQLGKSGFSSMLTYGMLPKGHEMEMIAQANSNPFHAFLVEASILMGEDFIARVVPIK
jgi:hypothetical protein